MVAANGDDFDFPILANEMSKVGSSWKDIGVSLTVDALRVWRDRKFWEDIGMPFPSDRSQENVLRLLVGNTSETAHNAITNVKDLSAMINSRRDVFTHYASSLVKHRPSGKKLDQTTVKIVWDEEAASPSSATGISSATGTSSAWGINAPGYQRFELAPGVDCNNNEDGVIVNRLAPPPPVHKNQYARTTAKMIWPIWEHLVRDNQVTAEDLAFVNGASDNDERLQRMMIVFCGMNDDLEDDDRKGDDHKDDALTERRRRIFSTVKSLDKYTVLEILTIFHMMHSLALGQPASKVLYTSNYRAFKDLRSNLWKGSEFQHPLPIRCQISSSKVCVGYKETFELVSKHPNLAIALYVFSIFDLLWANEILYVRPMRGLADEMSHLLSTHASINKIRFQNHQLHLARLSGLVNIIIHPGSIYQEIINKHGLEWFGKAVNCHLLCNVDEVIEHNGRTHTANNCICLGHSILGTDALNTGHGGHEKCDGQIVFITRDEDSKEERRLLVNCCKCDEHPDNFGNFKCKSTKYIMASKDSVKTCSHKL